MYKSIIVITSIFLIISCSKELENNHTSTSPELTLEEYDYFEEDIPFTMFFLETDTIADLDKSAALGRLLFYDNRLSLNNSISCGSCHIQSKGFSDNKKFSAGLENYNTKRNSLSLVNQRYNPSHFWEGKTGNLNEHILSPVSNHIEMGMASVEALIEKLSKIESYNDLFDDIYGSEIDEQSLQHALGTFVKSMISYNSKFDQGKDIDFSNFNLSEKRGLELYLGKANCSSCHKGNNFTSTWRANANIGLDLEYSDQGAGDGKFKIPSLRNIEMTAPYMHDGRFETLEEVVDHYSDGVKDHPALDWAIDRNLNLTELEKEDLVAFLLTLTDQDFLKDVRFSNPF